MVVPPENIPILLLFYILNQANSNSYTWMSFIQTCRYEGTLNVFRGMSQKNDLFCTALK